MKFYRCDHCGNVIVFMEDKGVPVMCCGQKMTELVAGATDGAFEKHVPVVEKSGNQITVKVGSVEHPSLEAHYIEFIVLETTGGMQMKWLKPGMKPEAVFKVTDKPVAAYEYCNLHGLWMAEV